MTKTICSIYLADEYCDKLKELLRDAMQRHEQDKPLPKFYADYTEIEQKMFDIIDKALENYMEDNDYEPDQTREPTASEEAMAYGEDRG